MQKYTVTFTYTYEVRAKTRAQALNIAEHSGWLVDSECSIFESPEEVAA